jgi:hypothetical protein
VNQRKRQKTAPQLVYGGAEASPPTLGVVHGQFLPQDIEDRTSEEIALAPLSRIISDLF